MLYVLYIMFIFILPSSNRHVMHYLVYTKSRSSASTRLGVKDSALSVGFMKAE